MTKTPEFAFEHVALNVPEPDSMTEWYETHLNITTVRKFDVYGTHFLADSSGRVVLEIYNNPTVPMPDYKNQHPSLLHLAFVVEDVAETKSRLLEAGATVAMDIAETDAGDRMLMLRDPWGLSIQFVDRAQDMLSL